MNHAASPQNRKTERSNASSSILIDVQVKQPRADCFVYQWEREREALRLTGIYHAEEVLPADLAVLQIEGGVQLPTLLLSTQRIPPGTLVQAHLLGVLGSSSEIPIESSRPSDGWVFVAVPEVEVSCAQICLSDQLSPAQLAVLKNYVSASFQQQFQWRPEEIVWCDAEHAAGLIRETRLYIRREQRAQPRRKVWLKREEEERPVSWRAIEGLSEALRAQLLKDPAIQTDPEAPHARAEDLIRFVPQRFQDALADLLLDDERLLAFIERPLLRHRTGWLGMQTWRSNEGLFLITDRQVLWLRDFLASGKSFLPGGYLARVAPLERLRSVALVPPGKVSGEFAGRLELEDSVYQRLVLEVESQTGGELLAVEFPISAEMEKALAYAMSILRAFLPLPNGADDRRVRRLPVVEVWMPSAAEAEQLAILGGTVPPEISERLERRLASQLQATQEELLAEATVPALEDYKSPARLIALTRQALLIIEDGPGGSRRSSGVPGEESERVYRYNLASISTAQLRHSLLGSSLSIFVPQPDGRTHQHVFPFHSPAIARFVPLFTRQRLLLSAPYGVVDAHV